jgi:hypothetical protein
LIGGFVINSSGSPVTMSVLHPTNPSMYYSWIHPYLWISGHKSIRFYVGAGFGIELFIIEINGLFCFICLKRQFDLMS